MLLQSKQLANSNIVSMHTGRAVGQLAGAIIDPHKLEVAGFYCQLPQNRQILPVLLTQSIRQTDGRRVLIDSTDEITEPSELLRHQNLLKIKFNLVGKNVHTASGKKLGKVEDYVTNTESWEIQKIYVKQSLFRSFAVHNLIIDRSQIIEVNDKEITVDDALAGKQPIVATPPTA